MALSSAQHPVPFGGKLVQENRMPVCQWLLERAQVLLQFLGLKGAYERDGESQNHSRDSES